MDRCTYYRNVQVSFSAKIKRHNCLVQCYMFCIFCRSLLFCCKTEFFDRRIRRIKPTLIFSSSPFHNLKSKCSEMNVDSEKLCKNKIHRDRNQVQISILFSFHSHSISLIGNLFENSCSFSFLPLAIILNVFV